MCYSAQIQADFKLFVRAFGARLDLQEFIPHLRFSANAEPDAGLNCSQGADQLAGKLTYSEALP